MNDEMCGATVSWIDPWRQKQQTGIIVDVRRSSNNPWKVAVVRLRSGTEVEVHPDRFKSAGANGNDR